MVGKQLSVTVIGGGIGGLAAALSLLQAGCDVHVYEQTRELREVGAGINITPNASRILRRLGLKDALDSVGVKPRALHQRRWDNGHTLSRVPLGEALESVFDAPHYQMHRADLLTTLIRALPAYRLHVGHRLVTLTNSGDRVTAQFENGAHAVADVLVGADGIHSIVRKLLFGAEQPRFMRCVAYRGLVPAERLARFRIPMELQIWMGPGRHFVHYYVQNGRFMNFVANIDQDSWTRESWTDRGEVADALTAFEGWHPQVRAILSAVDETFKWALFDREPMPSWSRGRVTLLGDACHPMVPHVAQGAAQAIEDSATLAACLRQVQAGGVTEALRRYDSFRQPRTARVQGLAAANQARFHLPDGPEQQRRDAEMATGGTDFTFAALAWLYGHDAGILDAEGSAGALRAAG